MADASADRTGVGRRHLCTEPWQSYYILRRGILPCCYGHGPIAPMTEWKTAWNSTAMQEIRRHLAQGSLSPYCLESLSCPIVQRHLALAGEQAAPPAATPSHTSGLSGAINRVLDGGRARIRRWVRR